MSDVADWMTSRKGVGAAEICERNAGRVGKVGKPIEKDVVYSSRLVLCI